MTLIMGKFVEFRQDIRRHSTEIHVDDWVKNKIQGAGTEYLGSSKVGPQEKSRISHRQASPTGDTSQSEHDND